VTVVGNSQSEFSEFLSQDFAKWVNLANEVKIRAD